MSGGGGGGQYSLVNIVTREYCPGGHVKGGTSHTVTPAPVATAVHVKTPILISATLI